MRRYQLSLCEWLRPSRSSLAFPPRVPLPGPDLSVFLHSRSYGVAVRKMIALTSSKTQHVPLADDGQRSLAGVEPEPVQRARRSNDRRRLRGAARRMMTRLISRLAPLPYSPPELSCDQHFPAPLRGRCDEAIGRFFLAVEQPHRAQRAFARSVRCGRHSAKDLLAHSVLAGGPIGIGVVEHVGLQRQPEGDSRTAQRMYESLLLTGRTTSNNRRGLIASLLQQHSLDAAAHQARIGDELDLLALASIRLLERAGQITRRDLRTVRPLLKEHLSRHPHDSSARDRLARMNLTLLEFEPACDAAGPARPPQLSSSFIAWTESTVLGDHVAAHLAKRSTAQQLGACRPRRTGPVDELVRRLQAINYVDGPQAALVELDHRWLTAPTETERLIRTKLRADLAVLCGDPEPLRAVALSSPIYNEEVEPGFRSMVANKNILLVGPSPAFRPDPEIVAAHDTMVTTGRTMVHGHHGSPSIVYLNNEAFQKELRTRRPDDCANCLTVLRPSAMRNFSEDSIRRPGIRIQPLEDSTTLLGTHFAIQRIIYDLIAHGASTVTISGIDFFLGEKVYVDGYDTQSPNRFADVRYNFSHDFAYDFWYTKTLRHHGLVNSPPTMSDLLDQPVESYLGKLGRVFL